MVVLVASVISIHLRGQVPIGFGASSFDEGLFVREASSIAHGHWLGRFDNLTLTKGPAYPTFIAWTHNIGLSIKTGEQLTYLLAGLCVAACIYVVTRRHVFATVVFVIFAFDPASFSVTSADLLRDSWYASLGLLFLASLFLAVYAALTRARLAWVVLAGLLAGVSGGAFWLCREEGLWIVPSALVIALGLALYRFVRWWRQTPDRRADRLGLARRGSRVAIVVVVISVALVGPILYVQSENQSHYGVSFVSDLASGSYPQAFADWTRVRAGKLMPLVPISRQQREAVYRVSPAAREVALTLEDPRNPWCGGEKGCAGDFLGAFMGWALRDAATTVGHFRSERDAQRYFGLLSRQIDAACDTHKLKCTARLPASLQPVQRVSWDTFINSFSDSLGSVLLSTHAFTLPHRAPHRSQASRRQARSVVSGIPTTQQAAVRQMRHFVAHDWPYQVLGAIYQPLLPLLLVLALAGIAVGLARPRWPRFTLVILCGAFFVGVVGRLVLFAVVDTTEFTTGGINLPRFQLPTRAVLLGFGVVGTALLIDVVRARWRRPKPPSTLNEELIAEDPEATFAAVGHPEVATTTNSL